MYKRIIVAIDDSSTSEKALREAVELAKSCGAALCIAHAEDEAPLVQHGMGIGTYIDIDKAKDAIRDKASRLLERAVAQAAASGIQAETKLLESSRKRVAELIAECARSCDADLLVVGTHGRRGFERFLVGSVAENLVRIATTSLMLVREQ